MNLIYFSCLPCFCIRIYLIFIIFFQGPRYCILWAQLAVLFDLVITGSFGIQLFPRALCPAGRCIPGCSLEWWKLLRPRIQSERIQYDGIDV